MLREIICAIAAVEKQVIKVTKYQTLLGSRPLTKGHCSNTGAKRELFLGSTYYSCFKNRSIPMISLPK